AAEASYVRARHGEKIRIVYAGACVPGDDAGVDASITLPELAELFRIRRVVVEDEPSFHERIPEQRRRHLSAAGGLPVDQLAKETHTSRRFHKMRGLDHIPRLAKAVAEDGIDFGFVDLLPCEGCLDNSMLGPADELYKRRRIQAETEPKRSDMSVVDDRVLVDVSANYDPAPPRKNGAGVEEIQGVLDRIGYADESKTRWNCRACGFETCEKFAGAFLHGRATLRQCPPYQERRVEEQAKLAAVDELTGLATYRVLKDRLSQEVARCRRTGTPFSLLFVDMDRFKQVNDQFGHHAGNNVLQLAAHAVTGKLRGTDLAARFGGDEFVLFLAGAQAEGSRKVAEDVRSAVEEAGLEAGYPAGVVTASVGVAVASSESTEKDILEAADRALYRAKADGGNVVV
ncbi:MAG: diguanylate cyclase, partial [Gemmatimonadota bacterium]|nr:diguanylate cyclase [Gemmatimonadota bacterium]